MRRILILLVVCATPGCSPRPATPGRPCSRTTTCPRSRAAPTPTSISIIQGLCEGEACGAVFNFASVGPSVKVNLASVAYINVASANGIQAAVDLEFFDGVTFSGPNQSVANLGPSLFRWSVVTGSNIGLTSSGINIDAGPLELQHRRDLRQARLSPGG